MRVKTPARRLPAARTRERADEVALEVPEVAAGVADLDSDGARVAVRQKQWRTHREQRGLRGERFDRCLERRELLARAVAEECQRQVQVSRGKQAHAVAGQPAARPLCEFATDCGGRRQRGEQPHRRDAAGQLSGEARAEHVQCDRGRAIAHVGPAAR